MGAAQVRFVPTLAGQNHQRGGSQSLERMVRISSMNGPQSLELSVSITGIHTRLGVPGEVAQQMIETGYVEWRATLLGIDLDWENAPAAGDEFPSREQPDDQVREPLE